MNEFREIAEKIGELTVEAIKISFRMQGHRLTGGLEKSINYKVSLDGAGARVFILMEDYGVIQDQGVSAQNIPFGGGGSAKRSKYIQGLTEFAQKRFSVDIKEAESIAFAIANVHKREGMHTRASNRFSKTGKRRGAIKEALDDTQEEREQLIQEALSKAIKVTFEQIFKDGNN